MPQQRPRVSREAPLTRREPEAAPLQEEPKGPLVSAVLVAYNQAAALRQAIEALRRSKDRERIEILVVDCGSQDESAELDQQYPDIQILRLPQHFGATRAMNIATRTAKAELVLFLSPYVEVGPDTVTRLAARMEPELSDQEMPDEARSLAAVAPLLVDETGQPVEQAWRMPTKQDLARGALRPAAIDLEQESCNVDYASREALLVRKQFIRHMNFLDERYGEHWADLDLAMQIRRAGRKIRLYPGIRATRHAGEDPLAGDPASDADRVLGAAAFVGKYGGIFSGFEFRLAAALKALIAFDFRRLTLLLSGAKIGSQAGR